MPLVVIFAGPNGSGKSTITNGYRKLSYFPERYLNADELAKERPEESQEDRERAAFREARRLRQVFREEGVSFAFETVFSHPSSLLDMQRLRAAGFIVHLVIVTTSTSAINAGRVARRFQAGGHDVLQAKIHARYQRTMALLPRAVEEADIVDVFDNSGREPILCLQRALKKPPWESPSVPIYLKTALIEPLNERLAERADIFGDLGPISLPDEAGGEYMGEIDHLGPHYLVQMMEDTGLIRHDRLLLAGAEFAEVGASVMIRYRDAAGLLSIS